MYDDVRMVLNGYVWWCTYGSQWICMMTYLWFSMDMYDDMLYIMIHYNHVWIIIMRYDSNSSFKIIALVLLDSLQSSVPKVCPHDFWSWKERTEQSECGRCESSVTRLEWFEENVAEQTTWMSTTACWFETWSLIDRRTYETGTCNVRTGSDVYGHVRMWTPRDSPRGREEVGDLHPHPQFWSANVNLGQFARFYPQLLSVIQGTNGNCRPMQPMRASGMDRYERHACQMFYAPAGSTRATSPCRPAQKAMSKYVISIRFPRIHRKWLGWPQPEG